MAWLAGWSKRIELAIGDYANDIGSAVTWFPVTIFLKDANGDSTKVFLEVGANSRKIAITKADGDTELKGEIEGWNYDAGTPANSTGFIHTSADGWTINANTSIFLYYDNDHADNANIDVINTAAGAAVWDGDFKFVCHMVDDNGNVDDSTSNNNDGTKKGAGEPAEAVGKVGQGQDFDGTDDYIEIANSATLDFAAEFTLEAIMNPDDTDANRSMIYRYDSTSGDGYFLSQGTSGDGKWWFRVYVAATGTSTYSGVAPSGNAEYVVGVRDNAGTTNIYVDGAVQADSDSNAGAIDSSGNLYLSGDEVHAVLAKGIMDEVRISSTNRSAAWIKGTYNSLWDSLLTYGSEELRKELAEAFSVVDSIAGSADKALSEAFSAVDSWVAKIALSEAFNVTDSLVKTAVEQIAEAFSVADAIVNSADKALAETVTVVDSIANSASRALAEAFNIVGSKVTSISKALADAFSVVDSKVTKIYKVFTEAVSIVMYNWRKLRYATLAWVREDDPVTTWTKEDDPTTIWVRID